MILKKNSFLKAVAVVACLSIISLSFPGVVQAADKKAHRAYFKTFLERPMLLMYSIFPYLSSIFIPGEKSDQFSKDSSNSGGIVIILGNSTSKKKPKGKDNG